MVKDTADTDVPFYMDNNNANIIALWGVVSSSGKHHQIVPHLLSLMYKYRFKSNE